jgi:protein tyrosine phosphatase
LLFLEPSDHFELDSPLGSNQRDHQQLNALLDFFRRIAASTTANGSDQHVSPIVIHCSAGIGRSGATIAIDILIHRIDKEGLNTDIDIPSLVKYIRSQRSGEIHGVTIEVFALTTIVCLLLGLVQTERQYELIYRLIEYYVEQIQQHQPSHSVV